MSWQRGRAVIERLLDERHLEQLPANPELARAVLATLWGIECASGNSVISSVEG